jgi:hypothetical protein
MLGLAVFSFLAGIRHALSHLENEVVYFFHRRGHSVKPITVIASWGLYPTGTTRHVSAKEFRGGVVG